MRKARVLVLAAVCVVPHLARAASESCGAEKAAPPKAPVRSATWSELPWSVRLRLLARIAAAPKLLYRVEKMEVYRDGVWVEYSITNLSSERKYVTPMFLDFPIGRMGMWDSHKRPWRIPQFEGRVQFMDPDTFIAMDPSGCVRFRSQVSFVVRKPIEPVPPSRVRPKERPKQLTYRIARWSDAYTKLTEDNEERVSVYVIGFGTFPVKWVDKKSPRSWRPHTRLYGEADKPKKDRKRDKTATRGE